MKCIICGDSPTTVGQVLACRTCIDDRTANEIPKDMQPGAPLRVAVDRKPNLSNRFTITSQEVMQNAQGTGTARAPASEEEKPKSRTRKVVEAVVKATKGKGKK